MICGDALKMLIYVEAGIVLTFIFPFEGHLLKWYCQSAFDNSLLCVRISLVSQIPKLSHQNIIYVDHLP